MYDLATAAICLATFLIVAMEWVPTPLNRNIDAVPILERLNPGEITPETYARDYTFQLFSALLTLSP